jgi:tRNA(Ile)-lysidine synthase TilS/MesJ/uncharacterized protein (DUF924 family)
MEHLVELKNWWMNNPNVWFDSTESDDIEITDRFEHIDQIEFDLDKFATDDKFDESIGYIIFQDQISRHIKRVKYLDDTYVTDKLDKLIEFVKNFYELNKTRLFGYDFCFVLLPLRHTCNFDLQTFVIGETWKKLNELNQLDDFHSTDIEEAKLIKIYRNYLKASYERIGYGPTYLASPSVTQINLREGIEQFIEMYKDILDTSCHHYKFVSGLDLTPEFRNKHKNIIESINKLKKHFDKKKLILSISGGVDSMVLSYVLKLEGIDFVMTHINYSNRGEICEREKELLKNWAKYIGVELYIRDIYEITRPMCMKWDLRDLYETYTKDARFQAYIDTSINKGWDNYTVGLAHNHDDCVENILTNICSKSKYDNLYGMELTSVIEFKPSNLVTHPIYFTRPFLNITKQEIYDFAHYLNIPYLFDSTPKWSQRGMIRDIVRPALIKWNDTSIEGFDELALILGESLECVDLLVSNWTDKIKPFDTLDKKDMVYICKNKMSISMSNLIYTSFIVIKIAETDLKPNKIFWSRFLAKLGYKMGFKNLNNLVSRIKIFKQKFESGQIDVKRLNQININKENKIYFWKCLDSNIIIGFD